MHTSSSTYANAGLPMGRAVPQRSLPHMGGGNRVARTFATLDQRNSRCVHALALARGRTECVACWQTKQACAIRAALNSAHRFEPGARMDLGLREHRRLRAEALDDAAHEWPRAGRGDKHGRFAGACRLLEALAHNRDELGEA